MSDIRFIAQLAIDDIGESLNKDDLPHGHAVVTIYCVLFLPLVSIFIGKERPPFFFKASLFPTKSVSYVGVTFIERVGRCGARSYTFFFFFYYLLFHPVLSGGGCGVNAVTLFNIQNTHTKSCFLGKKRDEALFFSLFLGYWFYVSRKLMLGTKKIHAPNRSSPQNRTWSA